MTPAPAPDASVWCVPAAAGYEWRHWDDESVLYDPRSGQTHLLNALAAEILLLLQEHPCRDARAVLAHLASGGQIEPSPDLERQTEGLLHQLDGLALIERSRAHPR